MYDTKETKETDFILKMEKYKVFLTKFVDILIVTKFGEKIMFLWFPKCSSLS